MMSYTCFEMRLGGEHSQAVGMNQLLTQIACLNILEIIAHVQPLLHDKVLPEMSKFIANRM